MVPEYMSAGTLQIAPPSNNLFFETHYDRIIKIWNPKTRKRVLVQIKENGGEEGTRTLL
jgi:hypothetical protein